MGQPTPERSTSVASFFGSSGLVPSSTSPTGFRLSDLLFKNRGRSGGPALSAPVGALEIDQMATRLRRMRSGVLTWARVVDGWTRHNMPAGPSRGGYRWRPTFVTLTYAASDSWEPKQISRFLACVSEWARRQGERIPYVWTLELQERGAPHYHLILWVPRHLMLPKPDKRGWWPWGSSRIGGKDKRGGAVMEVSRPVAYMAKYVSKGEASIGAHTLPKGARICGRGGLPRASDEAREARWWRMPKWLRDALPLEGGVLAKRCRPEWRVRDALGRLTTWVTERGESLLRREWASFDGVLEMVHAAGELIASPWRSAFCRVTGRVYCWRVDHVEVHCAG